MSPILQIGAVPVFIDADPITGNARCEQLEEAYQEGKTKAVMMAHALGNPFNLGETLAFCRKYNLWLVEDNCDALGCSYSMPREQAERLGFSENSPGLDEGPDRVIRWTGTWGDISTQSFYPPHHLTMGEGGAVNIVKDQKLKRIAESFRDWGRDCWCPSGLDNTCNKRFEWKLGELPEGYDHKYTYSHLGYNMKPIDPQAAIGRIQLKRLKEFIEARKKNWEMIRSGLSKHGEFLEFSLPTHAVSWSEEAGYEWDDSGCRTDCSWFGFKISVKAKAPFTRTELAQELDRNLIGNRMLFGGNLIKQPAFVELKKEGQITFRHVGDLSGSDSIMKDTLFLGTYPGLTPEMIEKEVRVINDFTKDEYTSNRGDRFVGSYVVNELLRAGHNVIAVKRKGSRPPITMSRNPKWLERNLLELSRSDFDGVEAVIHLADWCKSAEMEMEELEEINIISSLRLIKLCKESGIKRFVASGTCHEYGKEGGKWKNIPPDAPLRPITPYAASKAAGFLMLKAFAMNNEMEFVYARIFNTYGEGQHHKNLWPSLRKAAFDGADFHIKNEKQLIDISPIKTIADHLKTTIYRSDVIQGSPFIVNIGSGIETSVLRFCEEWWVRLNATGRLVVGAHPKENAKEERYVADISGLEYREFCDR